jgi:hypothetical protein
MLLLDAELLSAHVYDQGDYIKMLVAMALAHFTHTYQLVMTSAAARKEFMLRVDMLGRATSLPSLGSWSPSGCGITQLSECVMASSRLHDIRMRTWKKPWKTADINFEESLEDR